MDEIGELMVVAGLATLVCGDYKKIWPWSLGLVVLGAALYFIDRAIKRPRR